jgi:glucosamine--fructose-6-phosphate aminotransferase (isomerizing)
MCGIIAVLPAGAAPAPVDFSGGAAAVLAAAAAVTAARDDRLAPALAALQDGLAALDGSVRGPAATAALLRDRSALAELERAADAADEAAGMAERELGRVAASWPGARLEATQALLLAVRDLCWQLRDDRLGWVRGVDGLRGGSDPAPATVLGFGAVETALRGLGRLEVRGRDSAGLVVRVAAEAGAVAAFALEQRAELAERRDRELGSGAVTAGPDCLWFAYKTAAVVGGLGDNVRRLRAAVSADRLLGRAFTLPGARVTVVGHTRWASVGRISEVNAHPLDSVLPGTRARGPYAVGVVNGDIDNHEQLRREEDVDAGAITTDAKLLPVMLSARLAAGAPPEAALADVLHRCQGSFAAVAQVEPHDELLLAVRGSGQSLYVGFAGGGWVVASEPYGVVGETDRYLRVDGRPPAPGAASGALLRLRRDGAGTLDGLTRWDSGLAEHPVGETEVARAGMSSRDVALPGHRHYLAKEIAEAPDAVARTLRGRVAAGADGGVRSRLDLAEEVRDRFRRGAVRRVLLVGQGTAHVACQGIAGIARPLLGGAVEVGAMPATELSAWHLPPDLGDTCLVAVSQSGTTTDTNRAVDLARERGAAVVAVVNRRESDLAAKADSVVHTSDGRDVEMAVASTKAFYAQVAAGTLLALELARELGTGSPERDEDVLRALSALPAALRRVVSDPEPARRAAADLAARQRHWSVVGSGPNRTAAAEIRIKLSELCYKAVPADAAEDKKHIDLSAESMIVVCAAGLDGAVGDDLAKEVQIFAAHRNPPVVVATEGDTRYDGAARHLLRVPATHPLLAWLLSVAAGHLLAYECALAVDAEAEPLRRALDLLPPGAGEPGWGDGWRLALDPVRRPLGEVTGRVAGGTLDGCLPASTAVRLQLLEQVLDGRLDLDAYESVAGRTMPAGLVRDLEETLTGAVDQLTRSIDAIKHQAKTVTVGTSRAEGVTGPLVGELARRGVPVERLPFSVLRAVSALGPVVASVEGCTTYAVDLGGPFPHVRLRERDGVARSIPSRVEADSRLRGTKLLVAQRQRALLTRGVRDDRLVLIVPEVERGVTTGLVLLHVTMRDRLPGAALRAAVAGYDADRWREVVAVLTEADDGAVTDRRLERLGVEPLLVGPVDPASLSATSREAGVTRSEG